MKNINEIYEILDKYMFQNNMTELGAPEANEILEKKGVLNNYQERSGLPLRKILRECKENNTLPIHIVQEGRFWVIYRSDKDLK